MAAMETELQRFPASVLTEFRKAEPIVRQHLHGDNLQAWAEEGTAIARHSFRSWEAACEYFRATPDVVTRLPFSNLLTWAKWGRALAADSPVISSAFFRSSAEVLENIPPEETVQWATLGKGLYKGTWKSSSLCSTYFEVTPRLLHHLDLLELQHLVSLVDTLSQKSYDVANECLLASDAVFSRVDPADRASFLSLGGTLAKGNWRDIKPYFENGARILTHLDRSQRGRFLALGERIAQGNNVNVVTFLMDSSAALGEIATVSHSQMLGMAERLASSSPGAVGDFLRSAPQVLARVKEDQFDSWFEEGLRILQENEEGGYAFFRLESSRGERTIEVLSRGIALDKVKEILQMYCRALAGERVELQESEELKEKGIGWNSSERPATEGNHIYLPNFVERYGTKEENFGWFKVIATHQAAHLEFNSFGFEFDKPSTLFAEQDQRQVIAKGLPDSPSTSDLQRLFDLFEDRKLASDIFTLIEDARLDYRVKWEYRGLKDMYQRVQQESVRNRPDPKTLPLREALMEVLVRLSLEAAGTVPVPTEFEPHIEAIAAIVTGMRKETATVEDSAEATIRIYDTVSQIPNVVAPPEEFEDQDLDQMGQEGSGAEDLDKMLQDLSMGGAGGRGAPDGDEQDYQSPQQVDFRGDFKPELVQALQALRDQPMKAGSEMQQSGLSKEDLQSLLDKSVEIEVTEAQSGELDQSSGMFIDNLMAEAARQQQQRMRPSGDFPHMTEDDQPLESQPLTFLYDEWDFRAADYKPRWCCVRERRMEDGTTEFFERTLRSNSVLVSQIKRQFEMLSPQMFHKIKHLPDGDEYDFDAVVESVIERLAGDTPTDKVYWRRNKVQRDVAVAFLLDMSASTAEAIDEGRRQFDTWDFPDDPRDYMTWLRNRREEMSRRTYKRIIDIEKEGTVLLIKALEAIGDVYGIYGFSGYGRENVEFYVIKDMAESFGEHIKRRIDRITPMHATRMGPAIRHVTTKLDKQDARTKILFLISDGRPQDRGYSREGVEKEYAVHDTRMALNEARRKRITPFCLTVDRNGHDYLKTMMSDMGYEVLADIQALPKRLPVLYRRLTV